MIFNDFDPLKNQRLQILAPDGTADSTLLPEMDDDTLRLIFRRMLAARLVDRHCVALQREGRMGTYAPVEGQEACQVGSVLALSETDWIVPSFRELAAALSRGIPLELILLYWMGSEEGSRIPRSFRVLPVAIPVGTHTLHAAGMAMAIRYRRQEDVVLCYFGDGATSEGDFHEALTFAGVSRAPVIFFCQNNGWAISVPRKIQCAAESLALKGMGYGMAAIQIDGIGEVERSAEPRPHGQERERPTRHAQEPLHRTAAPEVRDRGVDDGGAHANARLRSRPEVISITRTSANSA
jgi:pyruvate dehydrogenase E1 component alpha subunit